VVIAVSSAVPASVNDAVGASEDDSVLIDEGAMEGIVVGDSFVVKGLPLPAVKKLEVSTGERGATTKK
jgi:hypothetical protein